MVVGRRRTLVSVLYVTAGDGTSATESDGITIRRCDVVVIPAGKKHWHIAISMKGKTSFTHPLGCVTRVTRPRRMTLGYTSTTPARSDRARDSSGHRARESRFFTGFAISGLLTKARKDQ